MKFLRSMPVMATGLALFAMLFGSGNIAFPLGLGRDLGSMAVYAMCGFFITAALVPVIGVIAMALCKGDYRIFMERIGHIPATLVILLCFGLIGPFCVIPRCIAFSHQAFQWLVPSVSLFQFTLAAAALLLISTLRKNSVIALMSAVLGPIKLVLLGSVIVKGLFSNSSTAVCMLAGKESFVKGLFVGYGTLDLLGVIFTSGLLLSSLTYDAQGRQRSQESMLRLMIQGGMLAALMLGLLYAGFVIVAAKQSAVAQCFGVEEGQLLSVLSSIILGSGGGVLASLTMVIACSTTAIGLTAIFAEFISTQLPAGVLSYTSAVYLTVAIATFFANYGAEGIKSLLVPVVLVLYPALLVLALSNIVDKVFSINSGKLPFYTTLTAMLGFSLFRLVTL